MAAAPAPAVASAAIVAASKKYGVPWEYLLGIYGHESTFGTAYESGGTTYGYFGLTSPGLWSPSDSINQDADIAAQTLSTLYKETGSWDKALQKYSGGAYGASSAYSVASNAPSGLLNAIGQAVIGASGMSGLGVPSVGSSGGILGAAASALDAPPAAATQAGQNATNINISIPGLSTIAQVFGWLTDAHNWLRALEVLGGVVAIYVALKALAGVEGSPVVKVATTAAAGVAEA